MIRSSSTSRCAAAIRRAPSGPRWPTCWLERRRSPPDRGLFLERTWRLHPALCAFTSEAFYDQRLEPEPHLGRAAAPDRRGPRRWRRAEGCCRSRPSAPTTSRPSKRPRSADLARSIVGGSWTDANGVTRRIRWRDVLIVAPYNAQVGTIKRLLPPEARVGTVDKFQGQEAPISIYSLTTSTPELAPRGMDFLYSRNRLNVATSGPVASRSSWARRISGASERGRRNRCASRTRSVASRSWRGARRCRPRTSVRRSRS